jgi:hypothetical protein
MKKATVLICILLAALALPGQNGENHKLNIGVGYSGYYSDNIFMNSDTVEDYVSQVFADLDVSLKALTLSLSASAGFYQDNPEFNSFHLQPSLEWFQRLKGRDGFYIGVSYDVLDYKEIYTDFNYNGPLVRAELKLYTGPQSLIRTGYRFRYRNYSNYGSFDFSNHNFFVRWSRFFRSQTTLKLQAGFNYRHYPHIADEVDFGGGYNYYHNPGNYGMGSGSGSGSGHGHGHGTGPGGGMNPGTPPWAEGLSGPSHSVNIPNLYASVSAAQGLGDRAGLTAGAEIRKNLRGLEFDDVEALIKNAYIIYPYNDDFLWDGFRLKLGLKVALFSDISIKGEISYADKHYPGIYMMDDEGNIATPRTERDDSLLLYSLELMKRLGKFQLSGHILYRDNRSNDDFFHYHMLTISARIGYYF